jgi:anthranilate phosphoribosyltransferase
MTAFASMIESALLEVAGGGFVSRDAMRLLVEGLLDGLAADDEAQSAFAELLVALSNRGEAAQEIAGAADALRTHMKRLPVPDGLLLADTCGTGGDGSGSFNISTATAFVVAAAGQPVAKHGNRSVSSRTGSADVLEVLGITIDLPPTANARCLEKTGICYCHAPCYHPAMARVAPLRKRVGKPTVFNLIGPLCNPAAARVQVIGVGRESKRQPLAEAAAMLGLKRGLIVSGRLEGTSNRCLDEVSLFGPTDVIDVCDGTTTMTRWHPEDFGIATRSASDEHELTVEGPAESGEAIREVLAGGRGPRREIVLLNAAATLWAAGRAPSLRDACEKAERAIDSGDAAEVLGRLASCSRAEKEGVDAAAGYST